MEGWYNKSEVISSVELTTNGFALPYSHLGVMIPVMTAKAAAKDSTIHRMFLVVIITYISPILLLESLLTPSLCVPCWREQWMESAHLKVMNLKQ